MKLSVIIPAYNAEKYINEAIDSVHRGGWDGELEVIVVDDGSSDKTLETALKSADKVIGSEHKNAANARNKGVESANGEFIFFLDADDILADGILGELQKELQNTDAVFAMAKDFISPEISEEDKVTLSARQDCYFGILPGCALLKKSLFDSVGLFDEGLGSGETVAWMMRLRDICPKFKQVSKISLYRRIHLTNTGRVNKNQEYANYAAVLRQRMQAAKLARKKNEQSNES